MRVRLNRQRIIRKRVNNPPDFCALQTLQTNRKPKVDRLIGRHFNTCMRTAGSWQALPAHSACCIPAVNKLGTFLLSKACGCPSAISHHSYKEPSQLTIAYAMETPKLDRNSVLIVCDRFLVKLFEPFLLEACAVFRPSGCEGST